MRKRKVPGRKRDKHRRNPPAKPGSIGAQIASLKAQIAAAKREDK